MRDRNKILALAALSVVAGGVAYKASLDPEKRKLEAAGVIHVVASKEDVPATRPAPAITALPAGQPAPASLSSALGLSSSATVRNVVEHDKQYGIICGEVSRDGSADDFRRFLYVGVAVSAEVDDGGREFEQRVRDVCKRQS